MDAGGYVGCCRTDGYGWSGTQNVGALLCLNVPDEANARLPCQIAAGSVALCLLLKTSAYFAARGVLKPLEFHIDVPVVLLDVASSVAFLLYLKRLSAFLDRADLTRWAKPLIVAMIGLALLHPAVAVYLFALLPRLTLDAEYPIIIAIKLAFFYGGLAAYIVYAHYILLVRRALHSRE